MSSFLYSRVVGEKLRDLTPSQVAVLRVIADYVNEKNMAGKEHPLEVWPSIATIARRTRFSVRTVRRGVRHLEARKLITTKRGGPRPSNDKLEPGTNIPNHYVLRYDLEGQLVPKKPPQRVGAHVKRASAAAEKEAADAQANLREYVRRRRAP